MRSGEERVWQSNPRPQSDVNQRQLQSTTSYILYSNTSTTKKEQTWHNVEITRKICTILYYILYIKWDNFYHKGESDYVRRSHDSISHNSLSSPESACGYRFGEESVHELKDIMCRNENNQTTWSCGSIEIWWGIIKQTYLAITLSSLRELLTNWKRWKGLCWWCDQRSLGVSVLTVISNEVSVGTPVPEGTTAGWAITSWSLADSLWQSIISHPEMDQRQAYLRLAQQRCTNTISMTG